jgi:2-methylcitrate dehydratase PrpD
MRAGELEQMASWASTLSLSDVPHRVLEHAKNQVYSMLGAVHSGCASDLGDAIDRCFRWRCSGQARVIPTGEKTDPIHAAALMSSWSMALDYDDVMLGGHTGHSSVLVPLAFAAPYRLTGERLLLGQIVANEIAARINMAVALGPVRGQMATYLHLIGAAAARARIQELSARDFAQALALAMSYPARSLYPAFLGSDAKVLCAALPIRCGLEAVDAALSGLRGNPNLLTDTAGFLRSMSPAPRPEFLEGLGVRWHTETNSYKAHPGSAYLQGAVEAVSNLTARTGISAREVRRIDVFSSLLTSGMDAHSASYGRGSESPAANLSFSTAYAVACAILFGSFRPEHLGQEIIARPEVWENVEKVRLHHDTAMTIEALRSDIPIGAALMNASRLERLRFILSSGHGKAAHRLKVSLATKLRIAAAICGPAARGVPHDLSAMAKPLGARVVVTLANGLVEEERVRIPAGFAGSGDWRASRALMRSKYTDCAAENIGRAGAENAARLIARLEELRSRDVENLIDLNTAGGATPRLNQLNGNAARNRNTGETPEELQSQIVRRGIV